MPKKSLLILLLPLEGGHIFMFPWRNCKMRMVLPLHLWINAALQWMFGCTVGCMFSSCLWVLCRSSSLHLWSKSTSIRLIWNSQLPSGMSASEWWGWGDLSRVELCISTTGSESGTPGILKKKKGAVFNLSARTSGVQIPLRSGAFPGILASSHSPETYCIFGDRQIGVWEWMVVCSKLSCVQGVDDLSPEGRWDLLQLLPRSPNGDGCVDLKRAAESPQYLLKRHLDIHRCGWDGSANR